MQKEEREKIKKSKCEEREQQYRSNKEECVEILNKWKDCVYCGWTTGMKIEGEIDVEKDRNIEIL